MKPHSKPAPSKELQIYQSLLPRKSFTPSEKQHYDNLNKGYLGELKFYELLNEHPSPNRITLYDFLFESNQTEFQIDCLILNHNTIFLIEIKNNYGDYYIEGERWYSVSSKKEIRNPLLQLQRTEYLFKQLLLKLNVNIAVKPYIVFVNDEFTLYQSALGQPIIFPTQVRRFIHKINTDSSQGLTARHERLAERFASLHIEESKNQRLPTYHYDQLRKGIVCRNCLGILDSFKKFSLKCRRCGKEEDVEQAVLRAVSEFHLLFPDRRITTSAIHEWCGVVRNRKRIRKILSKHLKFVPNGRYTYFTFH